jgi:hypothetical protein
VDKPIEPEMEAVREILSCFLRNPGLADSLEGVAAWRLPKEAIHRTVKRTHGALQWLVARGYLSQIVSPGSAPIFRLDEERHAAALQLLRELSGGSAPAGTAPSLARKARGLRR